MTWAEAEKRRTRKQINELGGSREITYEEGEKWGQDVPEVAGHVRQARRQRLVLSRPQFLPFRINPIINNDSKRVADENTSKKSYEDVSLRALENKKQTKQATKNKQDKPNQTNKNTNTMYKPTQSEANLS